MSVNDNLIVGGFTVRRELSHRLESVYDRFPELAALRKQKAGALSGGQSQMLALAQALMSRPRVLLLDEPSIGLSILVLSRLGEIVRTLADEGVAVLWSEQFPDIVLRYCDSAAVMIAGYCQPKVRTEDIDMKALDDAYFGVLPAGSSESSSLDAQRTPQDAT